MSDEIPNLSWYMAKSSKLRTTPRCPFANGDRCPRYAESRMLLANHGGASKLTPEQQERAQKTISQWVYIANEEETSGDSSDGKLSGVVNFCPEVAYEAYGHFVSYWHNYADELDYELASQRLAQQEADRDDPRWKWSVFHGAHYSECRLYSVLLGAKSVG